MIAAAVVLDPDRTIDGLADSKKLTARQRQLLAQTIKHRAWAWAVARAEPSEIDRFNILQASLLAMARAVAGLALQPDRVLVDGNQYPPIAIPGDTIVHGDAVVPAISAASILAKVARDNEMRFLDALYPGYEFERHKGYPTKRHRALLQQRGVTACHRTSFAPVKAVLIDAGVQCGAIPSDYVP